MFESNWKYVTTMSVITYDDVAWSFVIGFYNYVLYKIQLVDKGYGINFNEKETIQHYVTLPHPLFCAQNNIPCQHNRIPTI
jgi:hypothetical protein